jgi:hypothetical protein
MEIIIARLLIQLPLKTKTIFRHHQQLKQKEEDSSKENYEAKIDLLDHENNNILYSPSHTIKGEVILLLPPNEQEEE